jgi:translation initiation factor IF-2
LKPRLLKKETLECNVLEVRTQEGLGSSLSAILVNGRIRVGDTIVACGLDGPVVTRVRTLIAPQAMKEIRVRRSFALPLIYWCTGFLDFWFLDN